MDLEELRALPERDPVASAVVGVTVLALVVRFAGLGTRVTHFDEARVAWWTLEFAQTGQFQYRFIIHGPFIQVLNKYLITLLGPTDFVVRVVPALVGGLLPLAALLFRDHLRDSEVVALALFLAANPVLLYYSRFSRSTILVAGFMFVAFGLFVRAIDTRNVRYVYAGVVFAAFGFASKENAVVYVVSWIGASVLILDYRLFSPLADTSGFDRIRTFWADRGAGLTERAPAYVGHAALAVGLFTVIFVFFYAPRGVEVGLYRTLGQPTKLPLMVDAITGLHPDRVSHLGWRGGYEGGINGSVGYWFGEPGNKGNLVDFYLSTLEKFLGALSRYAASLISLAVVGFLVERYGADRPRGLVMFAGYWGFVSVLGYPLAADIWAAWITVNALVPLAIPAAVGLALVYRWGREALDDDDAAGVGLAALLLVLVAGQTAAAGVGAVYLNPVGEDNGLVQYAQPQQELRPIVTNMSAVAARNDGPDVLVYEKFNYSRSMVARHPNPDWTPSCLSWHNALPLPWYMERAEMNVTCAGSLNEANRTAQADPPFVIARASDRDAVDGRLTEYEPFPSNNGTYYHRTLAFEKVVFVHEDTDLEGS